MIQLLKISCAWLLFAVQAEAVTTMSFVNDSGDGLWGTPANWSLGSVPSSGDNAVINSGRTATIASNAPPVQLVTVGNNAFSNTTLNIGADLSASTFRVAHAANSIGQVNQTGGTVMVGSSFTIASVVAGSGGGSYTVYGGSLNFSNAVLFVGTQGPGGFLVEGSSPDLIFGSGLELGEQGTLVFTLDTVGITPLTLSGTMISAGTTVVDGSEYEGFDGYFPLILASNLTGSATNDVIFIGFGAREPAVVLQADGLWLRLVAPPALSARLCSLVPESTVATDWSNTVFSATRKYDPSGSAWSVPFDEAHVMDTRLSQTSLDRSVRSWDLRIARGGNIYSLRTPVLGETVPPSFRPDDFSPWNDDVWQAVAVNTILNRLDEGKSFFMHQAGVYMKDPILTEPFFSLQVASHLDEGDRSFTTVNWTPQAHIDIYVDDVSSNDWESYMLMYARYRDLGQGVIEATLGCYNYGPDLINWFNMPWGGVRRTSTEYCFVSKPGGNDWFGPITNNWGNGLPLNETGGWLGFSATSNGVTPALGFVVGKEADPLLPDQYRQSRLSWGYAGNFSANETSWRNYLVVTAVRPYNLTQGHGIWSRYYFVLGDDLQDVSDRIARRQLIGTELRAFDYTESETPLVAYSLSGSGSTFRCRENGRTPDFFLYAHPVSGSFPVFEVIENDNSRYLTWNPYANGIIKPYDGTLAGMRLLGFAMPYAGTEYTYAPLADFLPAENYLADGQTLFARTATPIETWRVKHFERTDNDGIAANCADPDRNGLNNLLEYAFGGDPRTATAQGILPSIIKAQGPNESGQGVDYIYRRRRDAAARGLTYTVKASSNLVAAAWGTSGITQTGTGVVDADFESVTNRIHTGKAGFVRLQIGVEE